MSVKRIEALIDAISSLNGIHNPESEAYQMRNPLLIGSFARPGKHEMDKKDRRVFNSLLSGYKAGLYDLDLKLRGFSRVGLKPTDPLTSLLAVYGLTEKLGIDKVVQFLKRALKDPTISSKTSLSYFIEEEK